MANALSLQKHARQAAPAAGAEVYPLKGSIKKICDGALQGSHFTPRSSTNATNRKMT